jgi:hypothetical protein
MRATERRGAERKRQESKQEIERHTQGAEPTQQHKPTQTSAEAETAAQHRVETLNLERGGSDYRLTFNRLINMRSKALYEQVMLMTG